MMHVADADSPRCGDRQLEGLEELDSIFKDEEWYKDARAKLMNQLNAIV